MKGRFGSLDGMRGVCALIVVIFHCDTVLHTGHLLNHGWLSVDVFFVLSGFVISAAYEEKLRAGMNFRHFIVARAYRLVPIHWIGTLIAGCAVLFLFAHGDLQQSRGIGPAQILIALVSGLFLVPISLTPAAAVFAHLREHFPINPPIWSLQGEWFVNLIYARFLYSAKVWPLLAFYVPAAAYLVFRVFDTGGWDSADAGLARAVCGFIAGAFLFRSQKAGWLQWVPQLRPELIYAAWFFISTVPRNHPLPLFESATILLIAPLMIALLVRGERPMSGLFHWAGAISYPLYASHFAIINLSLMWFSGGRHNPAWAIPIIAASLCIAWMITILTERRRRTLAAQYVTQYGQ